MSDPDTSFVTTADRGQVRWLTLYNPGRRNAIPIHGYRLLADEFRAFEASKSRVLVIMGAGGHFCAGADLAADEMPAGSAAENLRVMWQVAEAASTLHRLTKPTIAAVAGVAMGAGMNLALGCDVVIASETARFAEIFVRRGLAVDFGGTWLLPRMVGMARARELALTGREVGGPEALAIGLVARVVPVDSLEAEATGTAEALASGAPLAQQMIKRALDRSTSMTFEQAVRFEDQAQAVLLGTEDFREAIAAFRAKRSPVFRGR